MKFAGCCAPVNVTCWIEKCLSRNISAYGEKKTIIKGLKPVERDKIASHQGSPWEEFKALDNKFFAVVAPFENNISPKYISLYTVNTWNAFFE